MSRPYPPSWGSDEDVVLIDQDDVSNYNHDNILPEPPEIIAQIQAWLQPTEHSTEGSEYNKHLAAHLEGTGGWISLQERYKHWHDDDGQGLLWIKGVPGSGKSVHAANLIRNLSLEGVPVLFFFFRQIIDANHKPVNLLRDWLDQILLFSPPLQARLKEYVEKGRSLDTVAIDDLWRLLRIALAYLPKVYCVADALDEMDHENDAFLHALAELGHWRPSQVKVLMTSRPVASVEVPMRGIQHIDIRLEEQLVDVDIATYVAYNLERSQISASDQGQIKQAVPGRANGLFLYAKLAMNAFLEPGADVQGVLNMLPLNLDEMYTGILQEHARRSGVSAETQLLILEWVTHAIRPLRLLELADMIRTSTAAQDRMSLKSSKSHVRAACGPLLEILPDETVSVVHHSLTEFLIGATRTAQSMEFPVLDFGRTHGQLATACLTYMRSGCFQAFHTLVDRDQCISYWPQSMALEFPFSEYAIRNWYLHAWKAEWTGTSGESLTHQMDLFFADELVRASWIRAHWESFDRGLETDDGGTITPLHVVARCGLSNYTATLLSRGGNEIVDGRDSDDRTPLWWAATTGDVEVLKTLVRAGADPNAADGCNTRPIHQAAEANRFEAVRFFLEIGVDPLSSKRSREPDGSPISGPGIPVDKTTGLAYACQYGHLEAMEAFLPYLDLDSKHIALYLATESHAPRLVQRILQEENIDPDRKVYGQTPLFRSARRGDIKSMEFLVRHGADSRHICDDLNPFLVLRQSAVHRKPLGSTALSEFGACGTANLSPEEIHQGFALLMQAGADVMQREPGGFTALHRAKEPVITRLLLEAGADPNAETDAGQTPLHFGAGNGMAERTKALLEAGHVGLNKKDRIHGLTPLHVAIQVNIRSALDMLEYHPDCDSTTHGGNAPLHYAVNIDSSQWWDAALVKDLISGLLKAGADVNMRNAEGETPLHILACGVRDICDDLIRLLVEAGADVNARDALGQTPLFRSAGYGSSRYDFAKRMETFVALSADLNVRDNEGRTLLHQALGSLVGDGHFIVHCGKLKAYDCLLNAGLSPLLVDYNGNNLCHEAARAVTGPPRPAASFVAEVLTDLCAVGLDVDQPNYKGMTPLHIMCQKCPPPAYGSEAVLRWPLKGSKSINVEDKCGMRPIHYAASISGKMTAELLSAGADPFAITWDRVSALHIAAWCGESNIIGNILQSMKKSNPSAVEQAVNLKDRTEHTPLHYAARSGRPESVALLLEAGADPNPSRDQWSGERSSGFSHRGRWRGGYRGGYRGEYRASVRGGRREGEGRDGRPCHSIPDHQLSYLIWDSPTLQCAILCQLRQTSKASASGPDIDDVQLETRFKDGIPRILERFDMVTDLLVSAGAKPSEQSISQAIDCAADYRDDYIVSVLLKLRKTLYGIEESAALSPWASLSHARRQSETGRLREIGLTVSAEASRQGIPHLAAEHRYDMIKELYDAGVDFKIAHEHCGPLITQFVRSGLADLVENCCSPEDVALFENEEWLERSSEESSEHEPVFSNVSASFTSLLHLACERGLPNMDVIRVLVEKKAANVNSRRNPFGEAKTALHILAHGKEWWHVALAIPYLVSKGADVDIRNPNTGRTPLHQALSLASFMSNEYASFCKDAAKTLLELGADVNATDAKGKSCLSWADDDEELIRLLISHGAVVTPLAIHNAIRSGNAGALEALLSAKDPAVLARLWKQTLEDAPEIQETSSSDDSSSDIDEVGCHPLVLASTITARISAQTKISRDCSNRVRMMKVLLEAGASPYDTYVKDVSSRYPVQSATHPWTRAWNMWHWHQGEVPSHRDIGRYVEATAFHEILMGNSIYEPILEIPDLDLECRDARGLTPLLASCHRVSSDQVLSLGLLGLTPALRQLLERGANPKAVDNHGRNALHHLLGSRCNLDDKSASLKELRGVVAELVNRPDSLGFYPLHYGLAAESFGRGKEVPEWLEYVLSQGADPKVVDCQGNNALHYLNIGIFGMTVNDEPCRATILRLIQLGVNVNTRNKEGQPPLHFWARGLKNEETCYNSNFFALTIDFLDEIGVDWKIRDNEGRTVLHEIVRAKTIDTPEATERGPIMFKAAVDRGVDPLLEDADGRSSLDIAAAYGNKLVLNLFDKKQ